MIATSLLNVLIVLAAIGAIVWLIIKYVPMPESMKKLVVAVAVIGLVLWLLQEFGILNLAGDAQIPQVK